MKIYQQEPIFKTCSRQIIWKRSRLLTKKEKKIISAEISPALSSTRRLSQSGSVTNFVKHVSQNIILLQSGILFWHNMKIRLRKFWLPLWVVVFNFQMLTKLWLRCKWKECVTLPQLIRSSSELWETNISPEAPGRWEARAGTQAALNMSSDTRGTSGLPWIFSNNTEAWKCYRWLAGTQKPSRAAHSVPGTTLYLFGWKACNHFPWKAKRLCQFVCTLLQLKMIRCFQSVVLQ